MSSDTQQEAQLPNPFDLSDSQILDRVYLTHFGDHDKCDKHILFNIVSNVQMIMTTSGVHYVHQTTMWILEQLKNYSWDAKALVTVAAFAVECGNLMLLEEIQTSDQLGNSLKQLNQVRARKVPPAAATLVAFVMEVLQYVTECTSWSSVGCDTKEVPSLSDAFEEIPVVVYWILASLVACIGNIVGSSDYKLSDFTDKLSIVDNNLKERLELIKEETDVSEDYLRRMRAFSNPKDVVDFLKLLIQRSGSSIPQVYDGSTKSKTGIKVFKHKYVLLFFSGLNRIDDEMLLLNSICDGLEDNPKEVIKGFKKEDFKILWIPVVDDWDDSLKIKFNTLKNHRIKWYVVEHFSRLPGIRLIREKLNYRGKAIMLVLNPLGRIMNEDAMDLIFEWGIDAFPFREIDGDDLTLKWKWFWDVTKKLNLEIQVKGDRYIFIYGGNSSKWIQNFNLALENMKKHETLLRVDAIIEHYQLGKNNPKVVPRFWIEIESKKPKMFQKALDNEIQELVKSLLCLKQDPQGWVILSKGSNVKLLGHGEPMYQTVVDFEIWKEKVHQKANLDMAFKEYYVAKLKEMEAYGAKLKEMETQDAKLKERGHEAKLKEREGHDDKLNANAKETTTKRKSMIYKKIRYKINKIFCKGFGTFGID